MEVYQWRFSVTQGMFSVSYVLKEKAAGLVEVSWRYLTSSISLSGVNTSCSKLELKKVKRLQETSPNPVANYISILETAFY